MKHLLPIITVFVLLFITQGCDEPNKDAQSESMTEATSPENEESKRTGQEQVKKLSAKEMTDDVGLNGAQIDSLYNEAVLMDNGKERPVNSLSALEYIRFRDDYSIFQRFLESYPPAKKLTETKKKVVIFALSNSTLEENGLTEYFRTIVNGDDESAKKALLNSHVYTLEGKFLGGDFIYISDLKRKNTYKLEKKNAWYFKNAELSDPKLVFNGIIFEVKNSPWL